MFLEERLIQVKQDLESPERDFRESASKDAAIDISSQGKAMIEAAATGDRGANRTRKLEASVCRQECAGSRHPGEGRRAAWALEKVCGEYDGRREKTRTYSTYLLLRTQDS